MKDCGRVGGNIQKNRRGTEEETLASKLPVSEGDFGLSGGGGHADQSGSA